MQQTQSVLDSIPVALNHSLLNFNNNNNNNNNNTNTGISAPSPITTTSSTPTHNNNNTTTTTTTTTSSHKRIRSREDEDDEDDNDDEKLTTSSCGVNAASAAVASTKATNNDLNKSSNVTTNNTNNLDDYEDYSSNEDETPHLNGGHHNQNQQRIDNDIDNISSASSAAVSSSASSEAEAASESESASTSASSSDNEDEYDEGKCGGTVVEGSGGGVGTHGKMSVDLDVLKKQQSQQNIQQIDCDPALLKQSQHFLASIQQQHMMQSDHLQQQQHQQLQSFYHHHHQTNKPPFSISTNSTNTTTTPSMTNSNSNNSTPTTPTHHQNNHNNVNNHNNHHHHHNHQLPINHNQHQQFSSVAYHSQQQQQQATSEHQHLMNMMFNKMQDAAAPLIRTCSNASSTSSTSSTSTNASSDANLTSESSSSSVEGHLKALIMSAAAAAATRGGGGGAGSGGSGEALNGSTGDDPGTVAAVAAAFADQFAFMVRSRSSSLSDCSSTSSSMCVSSSASSTSSEKDTNLNGDASNSTEQLLQALKSSTIMKQMISSYQAALTGSNSNASTTNAAAAIVSTNSAIANTNSLLKTDKTGSAASLHSMIPIVDANNTSNMSKLSTVSSEVKKMSSTTAAINIGNSVEMKSSEDFKSRLNDVANKSGVNGGTPMGVMSPGSTPCKVCGDEASGFHYGVDSCEGCKGFFRRCITQGMNHQCTNQQQCEMTPFSRNSCQFCRLKKCFAVGMSREASRLGRRPKRPKDDKDIFLTSPSFGSELLNGMGNASANVSATTTIPPLANTTQSTSNTSTPNTTPLKQQQQQQHHHHQIYTNNHHEGHLIKAQAPIEQSSDVSADLVKPIKLKKEKTIFVQQQQQQQQQSQMQPPFKLDPSPEKSKDEKMNVSNSSQSGANLLLHLASPIHATINQQQQQQQQQQHNYQLQRDQELAAAYHNNQNNQQSMQQQPQQQHQHPVKDEKQRMQVYQNIQQSEITKQALNTMNSTAHDLISHSIATLKAQQQQQQQQQAASVAENNANTNNTSNQNTLTQLQKETSNHKDKMHEIEALSKLIWISDKHTSIERTNELEFIRTTLIEAHCQLWPTTFDKIRKRYLERPPIRVPYSGKTDLVWDNLTASMVPLIMQVVKFCKNIPGFQQIAQPDQIQLLKQGSFEVICVNSFMLVDAQNRLMLTPDMEFLMDSNTIKMIPFGSFMSEVFELGVQASPLKLTDAEIAIFNALLIMNPDRGDLQDKDRIEELQATLLHVLYKHLKYYRNDGNDLFFKILKLVPAIQEINRKHSEAFNVKMTQPKQPTK